MKKSLILLLSFVVALCLSMPTFAQESAPEGQETTEKAEKEEVKKDEEKKPEEEKKKEDEKKEEEKEESTQE